MIWQTTDFFPTLCALAGVPAPQDAGLAGRDRSRHLLKRTVPSEGDNFAFLASYLSFGLWHNLSRKPGKDPLVRSRAYRGLRTLTHTYCEDLDVIYSIRLKKT